MIRINKAGMTRINKAKKAKEIRRLLDELIDALDGYKPSADELVDISDIYDMSYSLDCLRDRIGRRERRGDK